MTRIFMFLGFLSAAVCFVVCAAYAWHEYRNPPEAKRLTDDRRTPQQMEALRAARQAQLDTDLERLFDTRVASNKRRRAEAKRQRLIASRQRARVAALDFPFRKQAN